MSLLILFKKFNVGGFLPWGMWMIPTVRPATKSASRYFRILYFFIIPQNGKSSVQKARESCRVQEHFGIFSPIFFSTLENLNVVLIFFRTFSWDFFRTCVRNFLLGRFSSISVLRTSGSMIFKLSHNAEKEQYNYTMFSWDKLWDSLFATQSFCALAERSTKVTFCSLHFTNPQRRHRKSAIND